MVRMNGTWLVALVGLAIVVGCGGPARDPNRPATVAVTGTVTYNGSPVEGATVTFVTDSKDGRGAVGKTDGSGRFSLTTFDAGDGAIPGSYKVGVAKVELVGVLSEEESNKYLERGENPPPPKERHLVPQKYNSAQNSGLVADVKAEGGNDFTFELTD